MSHQKGWPTKYTVLVALGIVIGFFAALAAVREYGTVTCLQLLPYPAPQSCIARGATSDFWSLLSLSVIGLTAALYGAIEDFRHMSKGERTWLGKLAPEATIHKKK